MNPQIISILFFLDSGLPRHSRGSLPGVAAGMTYNPLIWENAIGLGAKHLC
jgi:hypothetical protein